MTAEMNRGLAASSRSPGESLVDRGRSLSPALYVLAFFCAAGLAHWIFDRQLGPAIMLATIGLFTAGGMAIHARARGRRRSWGRRLSLALVGLSLFLGAGVFGRQSFQLEGFFFHALAGVLGGVVVHYLVAKIVGPIFIGRAWCGWGCWIWMVLDYLPWRRSPPRRRGWPLLRAAHFALSLGLVLWLVYGAGYEHGFEWKTTDGLAWFLGGCALYYALGIGLAAALKDSRAFCKYLCPVTVFLRAGARLSLLRIGGSAERCTGCGACTRACPMGIAVSAEVKAGRRVSDPECTLCQSCVTACPQRSLGATVGFGAVTAPDRRSPATPRL